MVVCFFCSQNLQNNFNLASRVKIRNDQYISCILVTICKGDQYSLIALLLIVPGAHHTAVKSKSTKRVASLRTYCSTPYTGILVVYYSCMIRGFTIFLIWTLKNLLLFKFFFWICNPNKDVLIALLLNSISMGPSSKTKSNGLGLS